MFKQLQKAVNLDNINSPTASAPTAAFAANVTAGNLIVVGVATFNGVTVVPTDTLLNTYTQAGSYATNGSSKVSIWYAKNIAGGANTVTVTQSASAYIGFCAVEYSGGDTASPLDSTQTSTAASGVTWSAGSVTVSQAGDLVFAVAMAVGGVGKTAIPSGTFAMDASGLDSIGCAFFEAICDATVTPSVAAGSGSSGIAGAAASFKAVSAGGGGGGIIVAQGMSGGFAG